MPDDLALAAEFDAVTAGPVARARGRRAAQGRPRGPARPGRGRAEPHGRHRRPRRAALHGRGRRGPAVGGRRPGPGAVRARGAAPARIRRAGCPAAGTSASGTRTPTSPSRRRRSPPTWRTASPRCGWCSARARSRSTSLGDVLSDVLLDLAPVTAAGRAGRPPRRSSSLVEGRTDLAPGGSLGLDPLGAAGRERGSRRTSPGSPTSPAGPRPTTGLRTVVVDATVFADAGASAVEELGCSLAAGVAYLRALTERRAVGRRGVRPAGVPLRRERRPVHDDRRAARRPPAVGPGRRGQRRLARGARPAAARRHLVGDDDEARPVGQHAAHDGGLLRRGRGRRRRRHRAAVRRRAGPARLVLPADRPQHAEPAGRGGAPGPRARPGRRLLVRRVADRRRWRRRPGTGSPRSSGPAAWSRRWTRVWCATGSPPPGTPGRSGWPPARTRSPASASSPTWPRSCRRGEPAAEVLPSGGLPRVRAAQEFEALRDAADAAAERPTVYLATIGPIARHTARAIVRRQPVPGRRARDAVRGRRRRASPRRATTVACICGTDKDYAESRRRAGDGAEGGRRDPGVAGRQAGPRASTASTATCSPGATRSPCCGPCTSRLGVTGMSGIPDFGVRRAGPARRPAPRADDWAKAFKETTGRGVEEATWETPEGIAVPPLFTPADLDGLDFLDTYPGLRAVPARALPDDVHDPAVDGPAVRRLLHRRRSPTRSTGATWPPGRRGCRSPSTCPPTAATTPTTRGCPATSAWRGSRSTRSSTCGSSSTASRWTG